MILVECVTKLSFMQSADYENVIDLFHQPLRDALEHTRHVRRIAKLDDFQYLKCGVDRVLDASLSGRESRCLSSRLIERMAAMIEIV